VRRLRAPSPALVISCLSLVVALGGTGYAVTALPRNSVGPSQLKRNAVNSSKVRNRSLKAVDFADGQLPVGAQGPQGPQGPPGDPNPNAVNSDLLDNLNSSDFLRSNAKAIDADKLDGLDSLAFTRGNAVVYSGARAVSPVNVAQEVLNVPGLVFVEYTCPFDAPFFNGTLRFRNVTAGVMNAFVDTGGANPTFQQLVSNGVLDLPATAAGDSFVIQTQGSAGVVVFWIATAHRATGDCHVQVLGLRSLG